jgi:hypothetical protein
MRMLATWTLAAAGLLAGCGGGDAPSLALKANPATFTGHGIYWNPAEPGTGFFFESQGDTGVITFFAYEADGRPVWYSAPGFFGDGGADRYTFTANLQRYTGGQAMTSTTVTTPVAAPAGTVTVVFQGDMAQVTLPQRSYTAERLHRAAQRVPATAQQPETGIYWNSAQGGRGYVIEVNANSATVGTFLYANDGQPTWSLVTVPFPGGSAANATGDYVEFSGGQTLNGPYKAPTGSNNLGKFGLSFASSCTGQLSFPGMPAIAVQRFKFGSLAAGAECRASGSTSDPPPFYLY